MKNLAKILILAVACSTFVSCEKEESIKPQIDLERLKWDELEHKVDTIEIRSTGFDIKSK